jgi:acyl-CoA synthetase (AMP-forming)/AMP-acid ligase II
LDISGFVSISQLGESVPGVPDTPDAGDPALLLHTSGTTGLPNRVMKKPIPDRRGYSGQAGWPGTVYAS